MNIAKTIEYLENVMSSEVRVLTLEKEIASQQAILDEKNEYFDYLKSGNYKRIYLPNWLYRRYHSWVPCGYFCVGPETENHHDIDVEVLSEYDRDYKEYGWKYCLGKSWGADLKVDACHKTYEGYIHNNVYFDKALDICERFEAKFSEMYQAKIYNDYWARVETALGSFDCIFCCIINQLLPYLWTNIDEPDQSVLPYQFQTKQGLHPCKLIEKHTNSYKHCDSYYLFSFKERPSKVEPISYEQFKKYVSTYFRQTSIKIIEKSFLGKERSIIRKYTTSETVLFAATMYPFYCELLDAVNCYIIDCFDYLVNSCTVDTLKKEFATRKIAELKRQLKEEKETRDTLYSLNVIYGKYRSIVPLGSFIDYFASGRCNSFDGPDGAYNLYENEIRLDRITDRLDTIIEKLDEIKTNQRAMYFALCEMNRTLLSLNASINEAAVRISDSIREEGVATRQSLSGISVTLNSISSRADAINAGQEYTNKLLEMSNERQNSIIRNQEHERLLLTDPSIFGGSIIINSAYGRYH